MGTVKASLITATIMMAGAIHAESFNSQPVPVNVQSKPKPAQKPVLPQAKPQRFIQVDMNSFFQRISLCSVGTATQSAVIEGKIYGNNNGICHYSYSDLVGGNRWECYVPTKDLAKILQPSIQDSKNITNRNFYANIYFNQQDTLQPYCTVSQTETTKQRLKVKYGSSAPEAED